LLPSLLYDVNRYGPQALANAGWAATACLSSIFNLNYMRALAQMQERRTRLYPKPEFGLNQTQIGDEHVAVRESDVFKLPFCSLKHFERDTNRHDPKVLLVAPMSGHYATLLRGTVEALLPHHDVYITDWKDAKEVPVTKGRFGLNEYVSYVQQFLHELGPETHVIAVCQPTVPVLAAISLMAQNGDPNQPLSMTMMGGPIDANASESAVTKFAQTHSLDFFRHHITDNVSPFHAGAGRAVYPGHLQLAMFMAMNADRHFRSHEEMFYHLIQGDHESARKIKKFYDEYLAVMDIPAGFYLDTVEQVFQKCALARGTLEINGQRVDPSAIIGTALFTVEGEKDDISPPLQTVAAHNLCSNIPANLQFNHLQSGAGHYGIFNGSRWEKEICPRLAAFVRHIGTFNGIFYDKKPHNTILLKPQKWSQNQSQVMQTPPPSPTDLPQALPA